MELYDLIVIGGGPGGYLAAERAAHAGLKTLLFEKNSLGGVCLNEGCIPSKALLNSAKTYLHAKQASMYGVNTENVTVDQAKVIARKRKVVKTLVSGVGAKMRQHKVVVVKEEATIDGKCADGFKIKSASGTYTGKKLIIATGSSAAVPPIPGVKENLGDFVCTNREVLELTQIPEQFTVIGGGVIGLEMAAYYAAVGSKVTVVEMLDHIAGPTDREISTRLQKELEAMGITFLLGHACEKVEPGKVYVKAPDGAQKVIEANKVLLSIGRRANYMNIGLETIGVKTDRPGIVTDAMCRTNVPDVYAIGDVNGHHMLAHTAYREAGIEMVPALIYTLNRDAAAIALVDSNLHRETILTSEKAFAYKLKMDAMRRQGQRTDLTSVQLGPKLTAATIAEGESASQVKRYIRLTELIPGILQMVDDGKIALTPAVELSYLTKQEQRDLLETIESEDCTPSLSQAIQMKKLSQAGELNMDKIFYILREPKANQQDKISFRVDDLRKFFPKSYSTARIQETILKLLSDYQKKRQRSREER